MGASRWNRKQRAGPTSERQEGSATGAPASGALNRSLPSPVAPSGPLCTVTLPVPVLI